MRVFKTLERAKEYIFSEFEDMGAIKEDVIFKNESCYICECGQTIGITGSAFISDNLFYIYAYICEICGE